MGMILSEDCTWRPKPGPFPNTNYFALYDTSSRGREHRVVLAREHAAAVRKAMAEQAVARWFCAKYRKALSERGAHAVALQLRKQGVPLGVALMLLFDRGLRGA